MLLPHHVKILIRLSYKPSEAVDFESCLLKKLQEIAQNEGILAAREYLKMNRSALLVDNVKSLIKFIWQTMSAVFLRK